MRRFIRFVVIFIITCNAGLFAQQGLTRLTEMQKLFFVAEASGLGSTSHNPASMGIRNDNTGVLFGYDFDEFSSQGNSSAIIAFNNFAFTYQDIYNINNVRLQNYTINLAYGNEVISIGSANRYTVSGYPSYQLKLFSFDAGLIFKPFGFLNFGFLARNLNEIKFDSIDYPRNYSAGIGLVLFDEKFSLYADADFKDNYKLKNAVTTLGIVIIPIDILELRAGAVLNPDDLIVIRDRTFQSIDINYQAFVSAGFLVENTIRITAATRFNDRGEKTRFAVVIGFPL
jgi:hypothetical protein